MRWVPSDEVLGLGWLRAHRLGSALPFSIAPNPVQKRDAYALVIDNLHDGCEAASERSLQEKNDTADLDQLPLGGYDIDVRHLDVWAGSLADGS